MDSVSYSLNFGFESWQKGETTLHGPYLVSGAKHSLADLPPLKVAGVCRWLNDSTMELVLRYIESPHSERIRCHFNDGKLSVEIKRSFNTNAPDAVVILKGEYNK